MKTNWTAPKTGATLTDLTAQASAALPHLIRPVTDSRWTDLAITTTGEWEPLDVDRINQASF